MLLECLEYWKNILEQGFEIFLVTLDLDIEVTDEELWDIWSKWYEHEDRYNLYAYDTSSEAKVYSIKDGKLVRDFPTKEEIMERMKFILKEWK